MRIDHHVYHHGPGDARDRDHILSALKAMENALMSQIDDLKAEVANNTTVVQSAKTLISGLVAQLQAANGDPAAIQAVIDQLKANDADLASAVAANTAAAPPATPPTA